MEVHLRKNVKFHDGTPFNAEAVKYSWVRAMTMGTGASWMLSDVLTPDSIKVIDEHTIEFHLTKPFAPFLEIVRRPVAAIVSPKAVQDNGGYEKGKLNPWMAVNAVGTGPFKLLKREPDKEIIVVANEDYWGGRPYLDRIIFKNIPDASSLRMLLLAGEIDMVYLGLSWVDMLEISKDSRVNLYIQKQFPEIRNVMLSMKNPPFANNKKLRQAMSYAVDYDAIIKNVMHGYAVRLLGPLADGDFGFDGTLMPYKYDPEKAKQLLAEAGYPGGRGLEFETVPDCRHRTARGRDGHPGKPGGHRGQGQTHWL